VDAHPAEAPLALDVMTRREDAERGLAALGETERALIVLHVGHGVGYPELADAFGLKEGAVRMRVSRALARMREAIEREQVGAAVVAYSVAVPPAMAGAARATSGARSEGEGLLGRMRRALRGAPPPELADEAPAPTSPAAAPPGAPSPPPRAPAAAAPPLTPPGAVLHEAAPDALRARLRAWLTSL
jgi:hypothetical protein